jgi:hypothetical protein
MICHKCGKQARLTVAGHIEWNHDTKLYNELVALYPFNSPICDVCFESVCQGQMVIQNRTFAVFVNAH